MDQRLERILPRVQKPARYTGGEMNAGESFTFYYYLGYDGTNATDERRTLRSLYTEAATDALELFGADIESENVEHRHAHPLCHDEPDARRLV